MYILIKTSICPDLKKQISNLVEDGELNTWKFVTEDGKRRLKLISNDNQYDDVVLRFLTTYIDGVSFIKILPSIANEAHDKMQAMLHFGIVLGRFSELLNIHFSVISSYKTILSE